MVYCSALNCRNATSGACKNSAVSFFAFPLHNEALLRQWIQNMGRDMETPSKYQRLCSEHFEESSFETNPLKIRKNRRLLKEAVPNKFVLGEDGSWLVGTPRGFCDVARGKTRKRVWNPERWRAPAVFPHWPRLQDWQNEFYKQLLKEKYGSLITLGKDQPAPKSHIPAGGAAQVKDPQDSEGRETPASLSTANRELLLGDSCSATSESGSVWNLLAPGHGGAATGSAGGTQPHGSPSGAPRAPSHPSWDPGEASGSRPNPVTTPASPAGVASGNGVLAGRELDEFRRFLLHHQGRPEEEAAAAAAPWFICAECGKSFARHAYLLRHQRAHGGQRPHACAECGRRFLDKATLIRHLRTHFHIIRVPKAFPG